MSELAPHQILQRGDFVRLKEPYEPDPSHMADGLRNAIKGLAIRRANDLGDTSTMKRWDQRGKIVLSRMKREANYSDLFKFTHGTVAEVVSRYPARKTAFAGPEGAGQVVEYPDGDIGPPRNVSLHLYSQNGLFYGGGNPTEGIKPEFVDYHVADLLLVQKHDETWGGDKPIDLVNLYADWDIEEPAGFDPWGEDGE